MTELVLFLLIFLAYGAALLLAPLVLGKLIRPHQPNTEKGEVYECGEPAIGSAWVQFDLRFYVVALLFVIFDVELAFFFPWAVVFGSASRAGNESLSTEQRIEAAKELRFPQPTSLKDSDINPPTPDAVAMRDLARIAFIDLLIFFGVLLVGFAYLWKRGDLEWVRTHDKPHTDPIIATRIREL